MGLGDFLKGVVKVGAPIVGTALGGPIGGALGGALGGAVTAGGEEPQAQPSIGSAAQAANGGLLDTAKRFITGNGGMNALGLAQGLGAVYAGKKAGDYAGDALQSVKGAYDANAPLRDAGRQQMLHPEQGIQAKIAAVPRGANPYAPPMPAQPQIGPAVDPRHTGGM